MANLKKFTQYVVDGFDKDGNAIFREATHAEQHGHRKHLEMVFAPLMTERDKKDLEVKAELLGKAKKDIADVMRVPHALLNK